MSDVTVEPGAEALPRSLYVVSPKGIYHVTAAICTGFRYVLNLIGVVNCHFGGSDITINTETLGASL